VEPGRSFQVEGNIRPGVKNPLGEIDRGRPPSLPNELVSDRRLLKLLRRWLQAGVVVDGVVSETVSGTPHVGFSSALLANICLPAVDWTWTERASGAGSRYADDLRVLRESRGQAEQARLRAAALLDELKLSLPPGLGQCGRPPGRQLGLRLRTSGAAPSAARRLRMP